MELNKMQVNEFVNLLGSDAPAPGGGAAAAITGAVGVALTKMVCDLTLKNKRFEAQWDEVREIENASKAISDELLELMNKDAEAYSKVSLAYKMPRETEEEKTHRTAAIQEALNVCVAPPLQIMEVAKSALDLTEKALSCTTPAAISDLAVAATNLFAAIEGGFENVKINTGLMKDRELADSFDKKSVKILDEARVQSGKIIEIVNEEL